ncbi:MAG: hypothetical protein J5I28_06050 [Acidimicrobiales bacterium]|nr:hypothetical protein [Acidimicrobiales bacterium]HLV89569.1 Clp protease N-terminal domain-containing protein [Acidimicrobiia bacterium]
MFEKFATEARAVVLRAAEEICAARGDHMVGAEHLLLAAAETRSPLVEAVGLDPERLEEAWNRLEVDALKAVGVDIGVAPPWRERWRRRRHIPFSGSAKTALKGGLQEALERGDKRIGVEHILLGITVLPPQDRAVRILERAGMSSSDLRSALLESLRKAS